MHNRCILEFIFAFSMCNFTVFDHIWTPYNPVKFLCPTDKVERQKIDRETETAKKKQSEKTMQEENSDTNIAE